LGPDHAEAGRDRRDQHGRAAPCRDAHRPGPAPTEGHRHQHDRRQDAGRPGQAGRDRWGELVTTIRQTSGPPATQILGVGSYQPERSVTNDERSQSRATSDQGIRDRVGIVERRCAAKDERLVDMAVEAGSKALSDAGLEPSDVDTVIVPNCTMPSPIPNAAAQVADRIGVKAAGAFDLNAACAGFCYALGVASDLVKSGSSQRVLVIGAEKLTDVVDPVDRANAIIFADGAGAAVVGPADEPRIGPVVWGSAGDL